MRITSIDLHEDGQPDFDILKERGWEHPTDLQNKEMPDCLTKEVDKMVFQIIQASFQPSRDAATYTRIFIHYADEGFWKKPRLVGKGTPFEEGEAMVAMSILAEELEGACHA